MITITLGLWGGMGCHGRPNCAGSGSAAEGDARTERRRSLEQKWLDWAHDIVRISVDCGEHFNECRRLLGANEYPESQDDPASDPTLRWPGFVGTRWRLGHGVLFIGSVHADFTKDGARRGGADRVALVADMADANRNWRDHPRTPTGDDRYLSTTRRAYEALIPGWTRDEAFALVREQLEDAVDQIAWTNLAHCRAQPQNPKEYHLHRACSGKRGPVPTWQRGAFPIGYLVGILRPVAILACVAPLAGSLRNRFDLSSPSGWKPPLYAFDGRTGVRDGMRPKQWAPIVAAEIAALRDQP